MKTSWDYFSMLKGATMKPRLFGKRWGGLSFIWFFLISYFFPISHLKWEVTRFIRSIKLLLIINEMEHRKFTCTGLICVTSHAKNINSQNTHNTVKSIQNWKFWIWTQLIEWYFYLASFLMSICIPILHQIFSYKITSFKFKHRYWLF